MTPTELTHRARRAYSLASNEPPWRCAWDELSADAREQYLAFADHLLQDFDDYRELLLRIHQFAKPIIEWTEPVFRQEVRRRELEAPKPIAIGTPEKLAEYFGMSTEGAKAWWEKNTKEVLAFPLPAQKRDQETDRRKR